MEKEGGAASVRPSVASRVYRINIVLRVLESSQESKPENLIKFRRNCTFDIDRPYEN